MPKDGYGSAYRQHFSSIILPSAHVTGALTGCVYVLISSPETKCFIEIMLINTSKLILNFIISEYIFYFQLVYTIFIRWCIIFVNLDINTKTGCYHCTISMTRIRLIQPHGHNYLNQVC